jgi:uncharacterized membrane protein YraQ (UPF0718 family)
MNTSEIEQKVEGEVKTIAGDVKADEQRIVGDLRKDAKTVESKATQLLHKAAPWLIAGSLILAALFVIVARHK